MSPTTQGGTDPIFARFLLQDANAFRREDENPDALFYGSPCVVSHLDSTALGTVQGLVDGLVVEKDPRILDLMASVDSHLPAGRPFRDVTGLGMNEEELRANPALTQRLVHDLNAHPELPFPDGHFDVVLNVVSVEYLTQPFRVFQEVSRVLKPGGLFLVVFSNRWFPPKVVRAWEDAREEDRIGMVEEFFHQTDRFGESTRFISMGLPRPPGDRYYALGLPSDPVFAVFAETVGSVSPAPARRLMEDPARLGLDYDAVQSLKRTVGDSMRCPYCQEPLTHWKVPDDPCIDWPNEYLYLCFNDSCPFLVRGWRHMWNQGVVGTSYRYLFDPATGGSMSVPIRGLMDLRPGIVDQETVDPLPDTLQGTGPSFSALPNTRG